MTRLNMSFFGTFQAALDQQPITHFRSSNNQGLLVYLALQNDKPVSREVLTTLFWPDESDKTARNNLRQSLYRLRNLLGDGKETSQPYLLVTRQTMQFNPDSDFALDVQQFLQAVDDGNLETAVSHYHGDLLPGFTCDSLEFEAWLRQERETLHHLALETMVEAARDCLRDGRLDEAKTVARQQLSLEPWREQAHRQLMRALAQAGDRGNALAQYEVCKEQLWEALGLEPAEETVKLYEDIKSGRIGSAVVDEPIRPPVKVKHNLPTFSNELIGRELEIAQISQLLTKDNQRLVSIVGPGGMGKTRLAIAVGASLLAQFRDGVYFVDLAGLTRPDEITPAIAAVLNYQAPDKNQPLYQQLLAFLRGRQQLLILDNFEHLLAGAAMINEMLQNCPDLAILVTSRQRLALVEENRYELGGLNFPDWLTPEDALDFTAVQLFMENSRRIRTDFALTDGNVTDVVRICQLVQGMPLGLLLAASWLELLTSAEIADEVDKSLDFLAAELADLPSRQQSMQAVFDYSWQMLTPAEQTVLAKLSVFRGGFTREAAEQVTGANLRVLLALVHKSLLQRQVEKGRFTMHELLRQFAAQQRRQLDANDEALLAHCHYFAREIKANTEPVNQIIEWFIQHNADRDNLFRAWEFALEHGLAEELANLFYGVHTFKGRQGPYYPISMGAFQALQQYGYSETDRVMLWFRIWAHYVGWGYIDMHEMITHFKNLIPILQKTAYPDLLRDAYWAIAQLYDLLDDPESTAYIEKAYGITREIGGEVQIKRDEAYLLFNRVKFGLQDERTVARLEELLAYFAPQYSKSEVFTINLVILAMAKRTEKSFEQAIEYGQRTLALGQHWQDLWIISQSLSEMAETYMLMGLPDAARQQHLSALEWHVSIGQSWQMLGLLYWQSINIQEFIGGQATAVAIISMVTHHEDTAFYHWQLLKDALPQIKEEMGVEAFETAWEKGKELDFETAVSLVRSALTSVGAA